jgi:hypothetical protein
VAAALAAEDQKCHAAEDLALDRSAVVDLALVCHEAVDLAVALNRRDHSIAVDLAEGFHRVPDRILERAVVPAPGLLAVATSDREAVR